MNNKIKLIIFSAVVIISLGFISSFGVSYCCEKTTSGAWCMNVEDRGQCATGGNLHAPVATSCELTTYCKLGTCINSQKGECMPNTAQTTCQNQGGLWDAKDEDEIPQCRLGCCLVGDQAAFTTQTACKRLSSLYGLETNYRTDITNELECIASATSDDKGACVFEKEFVKTCKLLTQKECKVLEAQELNVSFHKDFLCSADELATNCGKSQKTTCVEGEDKVYYLDSCGNLANVYDASRFNDALYWKEIVPVEESCGYSSKTGNANSATCGNCDYYLGSTCQQYDRAIDTKNPQYGENICRDLSCTYKGKKYQHGETWCVDEGGISTIKADKDGKLLSVTGENLPGGRYARLICYDSEVTVEPCAEYRQEVCVQTEVNDFKNAACKKNYWEQCLKETDEDDCNNPEIGDCKWINSGELKAGLGDGDKEDLNKLIKRLNVNQRSDWKIKSYLENDQIEEGLKLFETTTGSGSSLPSGALNAGLRGLDKTNQEKYFQFICAPKYAPGYDLNPETDLEAVKTQTTCSLANSQCQIVYSDSALDKTSRTKDDCDSEKGNCYCLPEDGPWLFYKINMCKSLGDCGYKVSYQNTDGDTTNWWDVILRSEFKDA